MTSEQVFEQMKREDARERFLSCSLVISFFLIILITFLVFALRPVTAHAKTISSVYNDKDICFAIPDSVYNDNPYVYIVRCWNSLNHRYEYCAICSPQRLYTNRIDTTDLGNLPLIVLDSFDYYKSVGVACDDNETLFDFSNVGFGKWSFDKSSNFINLGTLVASNNNIYVCESNSSGGYTATSKLFFRVPEVPVARMATELPEVVRVNLMMIVPIAVCCLASLIGLVALRRKLAIFLY